MAEQPAAEETSRPDLARTRIGSLYYGWVVLGTVCLTEVVSWGILYYAFSVFVAPMQAELGWPQVSLTGAYSLALLCSGLAAVPVGRWIDRHGPRALMTAGSILGSLMLLAWSQVQSAWAFYLVMAGCGLAMSAVLYEPAFAIVATWFRRLRGRALTVLTFFGAWASFLFIPLAAWLVHQLGWRAALVALAAMLAALTIVPHAVLLRRRPSDLGLLPDGVALGDAAMPFHPVEHSLTTRQALRDRAFWWLSLAFAVSTFATVAMTVHLIPFLIWHGHTAGFAATVAGLFGLMSLGGRLLLGALGDRLSRARLTAGLLVMQIVALAVLALLPTPPGALVYIVLFGAASGTLTIMRAALIAERYGPVSYGAINGAQGSVLVVARTLAPVGTGLLAAYAGGYDVLPWLLIGLLAVGVAAMWQAR